MIYEKISSSEECGSQDEYALFSLSREFLEAAQVLLATPPARTGYSSATYYLLGHSAELMLKAFLYKKGLNIRELKETGHNLEKLADRAKMAGLPEKMHLTQIVRLAPSYKEKSFEYRTRKRKKPPDLILLFQEIKGLQNAIFNIMLE